MAHISNVSKSDEKWDKNNAGLIAVGVFEDKSFTCLLYTSPSPRD